MSEDPRGDAQGARPLRVLNVIKGLGAGGAEQLLVSLARTADPEELTLDAAYVVPWKTACVPALRSAGVRVHRLSPGERVSRSWPLRLRRLVASGDYDVVHLHSPSVAAVARVLVRTLSPRRRPVVVSTEHNTWSSYRPLTRLANALTGPLDAERYAVSQRVRQSMWAPLRGRTTTLVHGIVVDDFRADPARSRAVRAELGAGPDDVVALTVANLRRNKAYPDLLAAAASALPRAPGLMFAAVGQGPLQAEVEAQLADLRLGDRFRLLGFRDDVPALLGAADVFVMASVEEGFPIAVMEAVTMGLTVVATEVGGVPDAVQEGVNGCLVPPRRPDLLADAVVAVARDREFRRRVVADSARFSETFDIRRTADALLASYRRLTGQPHEVASPSP